MSTLNAAINASASALAAERTRIEVAVSNMANAESTRSGNGEPYRRRDVVLASEPVKSFDGSTLTLQIDTTTPGYITWIDNWDAGWKARVDGAAVPVEKIMGTFKTVRIAKPGSHVITFAYRPIVKITSRTASAAVIIEGVTPTSRLMLASRIACQTMITMASRPHTMPTPSQPLAPTDTIPLTSTSCQRKNSTIRNAIAAPRTTFAPCDSSESLSILRLFLSSYGSRTSQSGL